MRYRAFAEEVKLKKLDVVNDDGITFGLPMPKSWSKKKKEAMKGMPHEQVPDLDNLLKALLDAVYADDSHISSLGCLHKCWADKGYIEITEAACLNIKSL